MKTRKRTSFSALQLALAAIIRAHLHDHQLTQTNAAYLMQEAASQVSLVVTGKLRGFSERRLMAMTTALGYNIDVTIRPARGRGKVRVVNAARGTARRRAAA